MGSLPMARTAAVALIVATAIGALFTLGKLDLQLPFAEDPYTLEVRVVDAAGLAKSQNPLVTVAGIRSGRVTAVKLKDGEAVVSLRLDPEVEGKIFRDARVSVRPTGVIPVLTVNVEPGTPASGPLPNAGVIPADRATSYVASDKLLSVLDADTRAYIQVLISEVDVALRGRGSDLERTLVAAAPMAQDGRRVAEVLAQRRRLVERLVGNLAQVSSTLARRRVELARVVDAGGEVVGVTSARSEALAAAMRELPATLARTEAAARELRALAGPLTTGLDGVSPALRSLPAGLREMRGALPGARRLLDDLAALERLGRAQLPAIREFTSQLGSSAAEALPGIKDGQATVNILAANAEGVPQTADVLSGAASMRDLNGTYIRGLVTAVEPLKAENFGLDVPAGAPRPAGSARAGGGDRTSTAELYRTVAALLERRCLQDQLACMLRVGTPGLPGNEPAPSARTGRREKP